MKLFIITLLLLSTNLSVKNNQLPYQEEDFIKIHRKFNQELIHPIQKRKTTYRGMVIVLKKDAPVFAIGDGTVITACDTCYTSKDGKHILIALNDSTKIKYYHLQKVLVSPEEKVHSGQQVGVVGNTGRSIITSLGLKLWVNDELTDPNDLLKLE